MARKNQQVETRMVSEYLVQQYPKFTAMQAVPLGAIDNALMATAGYQKAIGLSRPYRPEADAIVILPNYLLLIEAKVWNVVNGLSKLPLYASLVPVTPELQQYMPRQILMELVVGTTNSNLQTMAAKMGVSIKLYNPPWLQDVVNSMNLYWTADYQAERQRKLAMRKTLGVD